MRLGKPEGTNPYEEAMEEGLEEVYIPGQGDLSFGQAAAAIAEARKYLGALNGTYTTSDIIERMKRTLGVNKLAIQAPVLISKGKKSMIGVNETQAQILRDTLDFSYFHLIESRCLVEVAPAYPIDKSGTKKSGDLELAQIKYLSTVPGESTHEVIVSKGLAKALRIREGDEVRIFPAKLDHKRLNLDEI